MKPFPLDDLTLDAIEHALNVCFGDNDERGNPTLVGGEYTLSTLLQFLSGYDPSGEKPLLDEDGYEIPGWVDSTHMPQYSERDLTRALVEEVRRLRREQQ